MYPSDMDQRFARLERDIRRMRAVVLLLLVVAAGLLLAQILPQSRANAIAVFATTALLLAGVEIAGHVWRHGQTVPEILRAKKFEVVDDSGHIFVEIGETVEGHGAVVTHDGRGHGVLSPAHPAFTYQTEQPTPGHEARAPETNAPQPEPDQARREGEGIRVTLVYQGNGVYEAKTTDENAPARTPGSSSTQHRPRR